MKRAELPRICLCLLLCFVLCASILTSLLPQSVAAETDLMEYVRVGLCLPESGTAVFASAATSPSGFSVGYSEGRSMHTLFTLPQKQLTVLPDRNANVHSDGDLASGSPSRNGNYHAYNLELRTVYGSYSEAHAESVKHTDGFVAYTGTGYHVRFGSYASEAEAKKAIGNNTATLSVAIPSEHGISVLDRASGKQIFEYEGSKPFALRSATDDAVTLQTVSKAYTYHGFFAYTANTELTIVNVVDLETYVKCVMANEIGTNVSPETRRAFSVMIRTVPLTSKHRARGYDVCNASCCQAYFGNYRRDSENDAIVDSTKGQYIIYEGAPISCLYHASNGGSSCSAAAAWGGEGLPYLTSVSLSGTEETDMVVWSYRFSEEEFNKFIRSRPAFDGLSGKVDRVEILQTDPQGSGYVTLLSVSDTKQNTVDITTSEDVRGALRFKSANFTVSYTARTQIQQANGTVAQAEAAGYIDADGVYRAFDSFTDYATTADENVRVDHITFDGCGVGHGVGFSSTGAESLVAQGYSYRYLLSFYFPGTEITTIR